MAVITESSRAIRYGIELDSYRAEAAAKVLDHVIQGDALSAHARVESFGLIYANPPFDAEFGESGNQRFEVLFLSLIRTEDSEDEKTIIREREQFVHELALAFANGETALIE